MFAKTKKFLKSVFGAKQADVTADAQQLDTTTAAVVPKRTTSHSLAKTMRLRSRWVHVAQYFKPIQHKDANGIETITYLPQVLRVVGKDDKGEPIQVTKGATHAIGRNQFKRAVRINRTKAERDLRGGKEWNQIVSEAVYG